MDKLDLITIFEDRMDLKNALATKVNAAEQQGEWWYPLGR
jgi:hypothetical protein